MIKAVIFDCFGVLTTDHWQQFIDSLPEAANVEAAREAHRAFDAGMIDKSEVESLIVEATGKRFIEIDDMPMSRNYKNEVLLDYIRELRAKGLKTAILSNIGSDWITNSLLDDEEVKLFDEYVLSYRVGMVKPDPRIFHLAAERLGVATNQAAFVDDKDVYSKAAELTGMQGITYKHMSQLKHDLGELL